MLEDSGGVVKRCPFRQKEIISSHKTSNDKMVQGYGLDKLGICVTLVEVFVSGPTAATKGREGQGGVAAARSSKTSCRLQIRS